MAEFRYTAVDQAGKETTGAIEGADKNEVIAKLRTSGLYVLDLVAGGQGSKLSFSGGSGKITNRQVSLREISAFVRQLGDLISAGLTVDRSLKVLSEQAESPAMKKAVASVLNDVAKGSSLSEALDAGYAAFPPVVCRMVRAGEAGGHLEEALISAAKYLEGDLTRKSQLMGALAYPVLLAVVSLGSVIFIVTFLIPRLTGLFEDMGQSLPVPTLILLWATDALMSYWYLVLAAIAGLVLVFLSYKRTKTGALNLDRLALRLPIAGPVLKAICMARFSRMLGALLKGGVPILDSIELASGTVGNRFIEAALKGVKDGVRDGELIASRLEASGAFTPVVVQMVAVGEESGNLPGLLERLSDIYDSESETRLKKAMSMLEPSIILVMGVFIAFIIIAVLLPIFDLNASVSVG